MWHRMRGSSIKAAFDLKCDHSSILWATKRMKDLAAIEPEYRAKCERVELLLETPLLESMHQRIAA
jgi:hypothetical protein